MTGRQWLIALVVVALVVGGAVAVRKLSETEEARLMRLQPRVRSAFAGLRAEMASAGIQLYVISTRREQDEQDAKVAEGKSATKDSWHLLGRALDFNVQVRDPKTGALRADNNATVDVAAYRRVQDAAKKWGFRGVPNGSPFNADGSKAYITTSAGKVWDVFHLEFAEGMTFAQAKIRDGMGVA